MEVDTSNLIDRLNEASMKGAWSGSRSAISALAEIYVSSYGAIMHVGRSMSVELIGQRMEPIKSVIESCQSCSNLPRRCVQRQSLATSRAVHSAGTTLW